MNLISNRINFSPSALLQEASTIQLADQQKRAMAVALVIILAIAMVIAFATGAYKWIYRGDVEATKSLDNTLKNKIQSHQPPIIAAKCLIKMECEKGIIKKEFILKDLNRHPAVAEYKIDVLTHHLEKEKDSLGINDKVHYLIIFKDLSGVFHTQLVKAQNAGIIHGNSKSQSIGDKSAAEVQKYYLSVVDDMGFPVEEQIDNEEFVQGSLYVPL